MDANEVVSEVEQVAGAVAAVYPPGGEVSAILQIGAALLQSTAGAVQQLLAVHAAGGDLTQLEAMYNKVCAANDVLMGNAPATPSVSLATMQALHAAPVVEAEPEPAAEIPPLEAVAEPDTATPDAPADTETPPEAPAAEAENPPPE